MKKTLAILCALVLLLGLLAGCNGAQTPAPTQAPAPTDAPKPTEAPKPTDAPAPVGGEEEEEEENYDTGDASLDDPLNQDGIGETELLVVSFGTSFNDSRRETIGAIEAAMIEAFPGIDVRRGFTSQIIIDHVYRRDGEVIDNITQALDRAVENGVTTLIVQPTHLMPGFEYNDVIDEIAAYADAFESIAIGQPILDTDEDFAVVANAITAATAEYDDGNTAIVFMGHGTEAASNGVYAKMQGVLSDMGKKNYFIGTVEAEPSLEDVLALVEAGSYTRVVLEPLMIVAGDHANNDMAGDEEDSWKTVFTEAGYEVECILRGLGSFPEIQQLLVQHAKAAADEALEEDYTTGDASLDNPLNQDGIGETELLVVSFGTSFNDSRRETIGAIEQAMIEAFPEIDVRRGFTSQIIIDHVFRRDGEVIDNITQALDRAVDNGVKNLIVQPTHLMPGFEYNDVIDEIASYADAFESIVIGRPILDTDTDFATVAEAITKATAQYDDGKTAIVFMGHGTEAASNGVYAKMQGILSNMGKDNYFIGTVEAEPSLEDVLALVNAGNYTRVVLEPLMIVAGDHANNDMAGDEEDSWKSVFEAAGYEVECILRGLGSFPEIQQLLVEHATNAMEEDYTTGDASLDNPLNQDGIGETELLVVSFGTSFNDSRRETIGAIEQAMIEAFPEYSVRRGFTSQIIIDHVFRRDGEVIDNITQALERALDNGVKNLIVQPTHLMPGFEYNDVLEEVFSYADAFETIVVGWPILDTDEDFATVANAIVNATAQYDDGQTAIVFMGHGTEAESNEVYAQMQDVLAAMGMENYFIGTVEAEPSLEDVLALVKAGNYTRVVLEPLMIVAGDHANNDMAGDEEDSWKSVFEAEGYEVECILRGLGSFPEIQQLLVEHAKDAASNLD